MKSEAVLTETSLANPVFEQALSGRQGSPGRGRTGRIRLLAEEKNGARYQSSRGHAWACGHH